MPASRTHPERLTLSAAVEAVIIAHAQRDAPRECCGLLVGSDQTIEHAIPVANAATDPTRRYFIEPTAYLQVLRDARRRSREVIGVYHSHPRSAAIPSPTDAAEGFGNFIFLIVGLVGTPPEVTAWIWVDGNFISVPIVRFP